MSAQLGRGVTGGRLTLIALAACLVACTGGAERQPERVQVWIDDDAAGVRVVSYTLPSCPFSGVARDAGLPSHIAWLPPAGPPLGLIFTGARVPPLTSFAATGHHLSGMRLYTLGPVDDGPPNTLYLIRDDDPATAAVYRDPAHFHELSGAGCVPKRQPTG